MKKRKKKPYFESWYFREQAVDGTCEFTVRIDYDEEGRMTGSLEMEMPCGKWCFTYAHPVNMNLRGSIFLVLDRCVFTEACIHLDIDEPGLSIKGDIWFERDFCTGIPILGLGRKIWAMEQELSGELWVNGRELTFDRGKGYLEARRGEKLAPSEPSSLDGARPQLWSQSNWFGEKPFRIVCIGQGRKYYAVIDQDGYPIRLAWWKGAKLEYVCESAFRMRQGRYVLEGWRAEETAPDQLDQTVRYRLTHDGDVLFDEISRRAGYVCTEFFTEDR